jgi:hypothetical protein
MVSIFVVSSSVTSIALNTRNEVFDVFVMDLASCVNVNASAGAGWTYFKDWRCVTTLNVRSVYSGGKNFYFFKVVMVINAWLSW